MKAHITFATIVLCALCLWTPGHATAYFLCRPADEVITEGSPCPSECNGDRDCQINSGSNDTLCCPSTTCGQQCVTVQPVPFHSPAFGCPEVSDDVIGACVEDCNSCSSDELCCSNGCGHTCKTPVQLTPICRGIVESRGDSVIPGEYVPQCSADGSFAPAQCHGSTGYCWCVRPDTGEPVGESMTRFHQPQCNNCSYKGQVYYPGDSFPDDCNTCFCYEDGGVGCTEIGCNIPDSTSPYRSCPVMESDVAGICSEECNSDTGCSSGQKCCSNGCGHTCKDTVPIPYVAPTRECPEDDEHPICDIQDCTDSCENSQLCCQNPCGSRLCVDGVLPPSPCTATVNGLTGGAMLGQFIPKCNEQDGSFLGLQCFSHYCWCVDTASGEPTSDMRESGNLGDLECARCEYEGKTFNHNEVVEYGGGCATRRTCLGGEIVSGCADCEYEGRTYENGEYTDECKLCVCLDGGIACASSSAPCSDLELVWWHYFLIGGCLIALLTTMAIALLVVMVVLIRRGQFRHKRVPDSDSPSLTHDTQVFFKSGPPEAESVELKVPVEDDGDPVKT